VIKKIISWPVIINASLFQVTWFACVFGSAKGLLWPALLCCGTLAVWQLHPKRRHSSDFRLIVSALVLGLVVDSIWINYGLMDFKQQWPLSSIAPVWILCLWVSFALTINHSLSWLCLHPLLPAIMGLIGGPLSYLAGLRLGAVEYLDDTWFISTCLAFAWAISMVILVKISQVPDQLSDNNKPSKATNI